MSWYDDDVRAESLDLALWKKLFGYTRPYRKQVLLLCAAGAATALVDTAYPLLTKWMVDDIMANGRDADLLPYIAGYLGLTVAISFFIWAFIHMAGMIRTHVSHDIRRAGFERLQQLSFSYFDRMTAWDQVWHW